MSKRWHFSLKGMSGRCGQVSAEKVLQYISDPVHEKDMCLLAAVIETSASLFKSAFLPFFFFYNSKSQLTGCINIIIIIDMDTIIIMITQKLSLWPVNW